MHAWHMVKSASCRCLYSGSAHMLQPLYLIPQASHVALLRVLQVPVDASDAEIKKAYRKLSLQVLGHCHCSDHAGCRVAWRGADMQRCRLAGSRSAAWPFRKRRRASGCAAATPAFDACPLSWRCPLFCSTTLTRTPTPRRTSTLQLTLQRQAGAALAGAVAGWPL